MSTERMQRSQLSHHEDLLGCDLHAAMLPVVAAVAAFGDTPYRARAEAHLKRLWYGYEFRDIDLGGMCSALRKFSGTALEPFHCPLDLCNPIAMACGILAHDAVPSEGGRGRVLLMNHGIKGAWSGIELDGHRSMRFTCEDFRQRTRRGQRIVPPVPLAIDLEQLCSAAIVPAKAEIQTGTSEPTLVIELPAGTCTTRATRATPSLHFGHGFTLPRTAKPGSSCRWSGKTTAARDTELVPVAGDLERNARASESQTLHMPLSPSLMLRLAALPGAKRFAIRIPCAAMAGSQPWFTYSTTVVGAIEASGVRAVVLPWEGWSSSSPEWMPFVPFAPAEFDRTRTYVGPLDGRSTSEEDLRLAGTFDGLVDLLLDLSATDSVDDAELERVPMAKLRIRPLSILGKALLRMKRKLASQRHESMQLLNMA